MACRRARRDEDGHWYDGEVEACDVVLDSRWIAAGEGNDVRLFTPSSRATTSESARHPLCLAHRAQDRTDERGGEGKGEQTPQSSRGGITAIGLRGAIL